MIAAKKLPYSVHMAGDGEYIVLSRCKGAVIRRWRYWLFPDEKSATEFKAKLDTENCGYECQHQHMTWRLYPWA
jgi:hypothetical protein